LVGGLLLAIGLFTRPVAFILAGDMAVAYFMAHAPKNFFPLLNGGDASTAASSSPVPGLVESENPIALRYRVQELGSSPLAAILSG
jgi:hypothetical protein